MLAYVIDAAVEATGARPLVLVSPSTEAVRGVFGDRVDWAVQDPPLGTGHALQVALTAIDPTAAEIVVLSGDTPLLTAPSVAAVLGPSSRIAAATRSRVGASELPRSNSTTSLCRYCGGGFK